MTWRVVSLVYGRYTSPKMWEYLSCTRRTTQGNDFELSLRGKIETRHPVQGYGLTRVSGSIIIVELWRPEVARPGNLLRNFCVFFLKNETAPYVNIFKILFRKFLPPHPSTLLCSNFVKCCRRKIGEIMRYLPDKKDQNFACLLNCSYCADRAKNLPG